MIQANLSAAALLAAACVLASAADVVAGPDGQGWSGPGWCITGSAPPAPSSAAPPNYVLLEGPHKLQSDCLQMYERLYSPIGVCRFLEAKPVTFVE